MFVINTIVELPSNLFCLPIKWLNNKYFITFMPLSSDTTTFAKCASRITETAKHAEKGTPKHISNIQDNILYQFEK